MQLFSKQLSSKNSTKEHYAGELSEMYANCSALHFKDETHRRHMYKSCCHFSKLTYVLRNAYPEYFKTLLTNVESRDHKNFKANIRSYNSTLSFVSMGANVQQFTQGVHFFKIHGQVYHNTYNINPLENVERRYSQLYVIDTDNATDLRSKNPANEKCDRAILYNLDRVMQDVNPYAEAFKNLAEVERNARQEGTMLMDLNMVFNANIHRNMNRYNVPTAGEIAMIFNY